MMPVFVTHQHIDHLTHLVSHPVRPSPWMGRSAADDSGRVRLQCLAGLWPNAGRCHAALHRLLASVYVELSPRPRHCQIEFLPQQEPFELCRIGWSSRICRRPILSSGHTARRDDICVHHAKCAALLRIRQCAVRVPGGRQRASAESSRAGEYFESSRNYSIFFFCIINYI